MRGTFVKSPLEDDHIKVDDSSSQFGPRESTND